MCVVKSQLRKLGRETSRAAKRHLAKNLPKKLRKRELMAFWLLPSPSPLARLSKNAAYMYLAGRACMMG